jgi:hypothetical protein
MRSSLVFDSKFLVEGVVGFSAIMNPFSKHRQWGRHEKMRSVEVEEFRTPPKWARCERRI